jgi:hypothetical protein
MHNSRIVFAAAKGTDWVLLLSFKQAVLYCVCTRVKAGIETASCFVSCLL